MFVAPVSGDHGSGGAADAADAGERRAEPTELLPVQTAGRGHGRPRGETAAQAGRGAPAPGGGWPRDAPQQPETGRVPSAGVWVADARGRSGREMWAEVKSSPQVMSTA